MRGEGWLLRAGEFLVGYAARRLPASAREQRRREWLAELPVILRDPGTRPGSLRAARMLAYALGTLRAAVQTGALLRYQGAHRRAAGRPDAGLRAWHLPGRGADRRVTAEAVITMITMPLAGYWIYEWTAAPRVLGVFLTYPNLPPLGFWAVNWLLWIAWLARYVIRRPAGGGSLLAPSVWGLAGTGTASAWLLALSAARRARGPAGLLHLQSVLSAGVCVLSVACLGAGILLGIRQARIRWSHRASAQR